jgi:hypothetical protein
MAGLMRPVSSIGTFVDSESRAFMKNMTIDARVVVIQKPLSLEVPILHTVL